MQIEQVLRKLRAAMIDDFVRTLAHRIARFPAAAHVVVKDRVNAIALPSIEDLRRDSDLFLRACVIPRRKA